jgi:hypothetical protein
MTQTQVPQGNRNVTVYEDTSWERMLSGETSRLIGYVRPWASLMVTFGAGALSHKLFGHMPDVPWAAAGLSIGDVMLPGFAWFTSRLAPVGRAHTSFSVGALMTWLTIATISGATSPVPAGMLGILGSTLALSWNIRGHARARSESAAGAPADRLASWFADAAKENGLPGAKLTAIATGPTKATATVQLEDGKTAGDLLNKVAAIESSAKLPPGAIVTTLDPDRADHAGFSLSDPRVLTRPIPWPGPSAPGQSIAQPLRPGRWQTGDDVFYVIVGHHVFMMGASGSGKSVGGGWNLLGEIITRPDAAVFGMDITKGNQTFGPLRPGFHRFEKDIKGTRDLVGGLSSIIQPRTDFLADRGLQKWQEGCGLSYLVFWIEETADVFDKIGSKGEDQLINAARALRSAGGTLVFSVQRNTFDQIPTIIRGQMASMCFGLNDPLDCKYGLSEAQLNAGVNPAEWGIRHPGKAVLDAPTIPEELITMPLRTYDWGGNADIMAAHAAAYPASSRPVDPITAQICGGPALASGPLTQVIPEAPAAAPVRPVVTLTTAAAGPDDQADEADQDDVLGNPVAEYIGSDDDDPSPDITAEATAAGPDAPIEPGPDDEPFEFDTGQKMSPEDARAVFAAQLAEWRAGGRESFAPRDFGEVMSRTGMGRAWVQARLKDAIEADSPVIERDDSERCYRFTGELVGSAR